MGARAEAEGAPGAPKGQTASAAEIGAGSGHGIACGGPGLGAGVAAAAGDVRAGTASEWLGWRDGSGAGVGGVGAVAGKRRG